jgi:ArsR family transcriptional regulator
MSESYSEQAKIMKAFCDENRLKILAVLREGEQCACKLLEHLEIGQPALSYHMKILVESGVVESRACGKWTHYRLSESGAQHAVSLLSKTLAFDNTASEGCSADGACICGRKRAAGERA